jgi:hypothetical protein
MNMPTLKLILQARPFLLHILIHSFERNGFKMSNIIPAGGSYSFYQPKYSHETFPTLEIGEENINYLSKT